MYTGNLPADSARPPPTGAPGGLHGNYFKGHGDAALARVRGIVLRHFERSISALYSACFDESRSFLAWLRNPKGTLESAHSRYGVEFFVIVL